MSKLAIMGVVCLVLLIVVAATVQSESIKLLIAIIGVLVFGGFSFGVLWWATKHPSLANTEGSEFVQSRLIDMATKHMALLPAVPPSGDPLNPTMLDTREGDAA